MNNIPPPKKRQGMAITSLVLGILSVMCFGLFTGLPAIILGHKAHRRARTQPEAYEGDGLAIAGFVMGYLSIVTTIAIMGLLAGMLLPALAKAKAKAQSIACVNNMKQIGLAFRIWATDHEERFPFNASTNETGTVEAGAITDPIQVFRTLSNELSSPKILVCPADGSKRPARSFANLDASNVSYELETSSAVTTANPQEVLARCPVHGHELFCDGSVHQSRWR